MYYNKYYILIRVYYIIIMWNCRLYLFCVYLSNYIPSYYSLQYVLQLYIQINIYYILCVYQLLLFAILLLINNYSSFVGYTQKIIITNIMNCIEKTVVCMASVMFQSSNNHPM